MVQRAAVLALVVALAALGVPGTASAHANLVGSDPAANTVIGAMPPELILWFTETPELRFSDVRVIGPDGQPVDNGDLHVHGGDPRVRGIDARPGDPRVLGITVKPNLPGGTYTVVWKVLSSVDGHVTRGFYAFSVGAPSAPGSAPPVAELGTGSGPPRWLSSAARWVTFAGLFLTLGFASFPLLVAAPAMERAGLAPRPGGLAKALAGAALALLLAGTLFALVRQAWGAAGSLSDAFGAPLRDVLTSTRFGDIWIARAALTALAVEGFVLARPWRAAKLDRRLPAAWLPLLLAAVGLPLTVSMNSHAAAGEAARLATALDWLHLVAGGLWAGGLAVFALWLADDLRAAEPERRARALAAAVPRFSALAVVAVATLAGTGAYQWWRQLGDVSATTGSAYGRLILAKMALVAPLLALGAFNLLVARPCLAAALRGRLERAHAAARALGRSVPAEAGLAVAVLAVTAVLTDTSPPSEPVTSAAPPIEGILQTRTVDDLTLSLSVDPGKVGQNRMDFYLQDNDGDERPVVRFIVRLTYLDENLGTAEDDATGVHPTHFVLEGNQIALPGRWRLDVVVRREGLDDARATFEFEVAPP